MDALALLRLQIEWGADEALSETPVDRLRPLVAPSPPSTGRPVALAPMADVRPGSAADRARAAAQAAGSLAALRDAIAAFDGCALRDTASSLVFATGDPAARLLLIGEPPGAEEDRSGLPFAGREGALLDRMLASIGLDRAGLLLAPLIPWRPPGGRPPNPPELAACLPFLHRLIELAAPAHVVLSGTLTARTLMPARRRVGGWAPLSGQWGSVPALILPGLATLVRTPAQRRDAWTALRLLRRALDGEAVAGSEEKPAAADLMAPELPPA
jgi:DNA polymerase